MLIVRFICNTVNNILAFRWNEAVWKKKAKFDIVVLCVLLTLCSKLHKIADLPLPVCIHYNPPHPTYLPSQFAGWGPEQAQTYPRVLLETSGLFIHHLYPTPHTPQPTIPPFRPLIRPRKASSFFPPSPFRSLPLSLLFFSIALFLFLLLRMSFSPSDSSQTHRACGLKLRAFKSVWGKANLPGEWERIQRGAEREARSTDR